MTTRALLAAFAGIPLEADLRLETLNSELTQGVLRVDKLYQCERPTADPFLVHFEAVSTFRNDTMAKQAAYIRGIVEKYKRPLRSYMLLMRRGGVPAHRLLALERAALYHRKMDEATRIGLERGMQQGMEQGMHRGIARGHRDSLQRVLLVRFGAAPQWAFEQIAAAREPQLLAWLDRAVTAPLLEEVLLPPK